MLMDQTSCPFYIRFMVAVMHSFQITGPIQNTCESHLTNIEHLGESRDEYRIFFE